YWCGWDGRICHGSRSVDLERVVRAALSDARPGDELSELSADAGQGDFAGTGVAGGGRHYPDGGRGTNTRECNGPGDHCVNSHISQHSIATGVGRALALAAAAQ